MYRSRKNRCGIGKPPTYDCIPDVFLSEFIVHFATQFSRRKKKRLSMFARCCVPARAAAAHTSQTNLSCTRAAATWQKSASALVRFEVLIAQRSAISACRILTRTRAHLQRRHRGTRARERAARRRLTLLCADRGEAAAKRATTQLVCVAPTATRPSDAHR